MKTFDYIINEANQRIEEKDSPNQVAALAHVALSNGCRIVFADWCDATILMGIEAKSVIFDIDNNEWN